MTSTTSAVHPEPATGRSWISDTMVVLGILAFGYFALMIDAVLPWSVAAGLRLFG